MPFASVLFERPHRATDADAPETPSCFADLHLDGLFEAVAAGREEYDLTPFFRLPLGDVQGIAYRHEILQDLEREVLRETVESFARGMRAVREHAAQAGRLRHEYQKAAWFLEAVGVYCDAVARLADELSRTEVASRGLRALRDHLSAYVGSAGFRSLAAETQRRKDELSAVAYRVHIKGKRVTVARAGAEPDYSAEVEQTFRKFRQGAVRSYRVAFRDPPEMNHVEEGVLDLVARLHPEVFLALRDYCERHRGYLDETIGRFDREVQFYLAYLDFTAGLKAAGLPFCYPQVSDRSREIRADDTFDLALANRLVGQHAAVVRNDFHLAGPERVLVVSGPNQGGKTTFARTFGQLHYLASLGYPVPGRSARLLLCDRLFTHFEREEHVENRRSKLQDELIRIRDILREATATSVVVMNESFSATTLRDNLYLGRRVLREIVRRGMLAVYVTFIDELSTIDEAVVSMVSTVEPDNPAVRTYRVVRRPADGLAYAAALAARHGLTYESVKRRVAR